MEGKRSNTSDEALRPAFSMDQADELHCELTDFLSAMGRIHDGNQEFHGGRYQELLLTNRQYAFARYGEGSTVITALTMMKTAQNLIFLFRPASRRQSVLRRRWNRFLP